MSRVGIRLKPDAASSTGGMDLELQIALFHHQPGIPLIGKDAPEKTIFQMIPCPQHRLYRGRNDKALRVLPCLILVFENRQERVPSVTGIAIERNEVIGKGVGILPPGKHPRFKSRIPDDIFAKCHGISAQGK
jgi:hypothetical protein